MTDTAGQPGGQTESGREGLTQNWLTLWRSELAGMAVDRELRESWAAMTGLWAQTMQEAAAAARAAAAAHEPAGRAGADAPAGPAPAAAAPDPRLDEIEQLNRRVAELERRLAAVGPGAAKPVRAARPARRRGAD